MIHFKLTVLCVTIGLVCHVLTAQIKVTDGWSGGMTGEVTIHSHHPVHGWKIHIVLENVYRVLETGFGTVRRVNAHEWTIENSSWDAKVNPGFKISFVARLGSGVVATSGHGGTYTMEVHSNSHLVKTTALPAITKPTALPSSTKTTALPASTKTTALPTSTKTTALPTSTKLVTTAPLTSTAMVFTATSATVSSGTK